MLDSVAYMAPHPIGAPLSGPAAGCVSEPGHVVSSARSTLHHHGGAPARSVALASHRSLIPSRLHCLRPRPFIVVRNTPSGDGRGLLLFHCQSSAHDPRSGLTNNKCAGRIAKGKGRPPRMPRPSRRGIFVSRPRRQPQLHLRCSSHSSLPPFADNQDGFLT